MQLLFAVNRDEQLGFEEAKKRYWKSIQDTFGLFLLNLHVMIEVSRVSNMDMERRRSKHLPTEMDKRFSDKLFNNSLIKNLEINRELKKELTKFQFESSLNSDYFESIYSEFAKTKEYEKYISTECDNKDHLNIILELYRFCRQNDLFNEIMEDHYGTWQDDKSVVIGAIKKVLKDLPHAEEKFFLEFGPSDETVNEFGYNLFEKTYKSDELLQSYIEPTLKNWDADRLAILDMIILKMATCEFISFQSIPSKVTLNEYVDISKNYSTAKSKEFINGVLDKVLSELDSKGLVIKEGRGLDE